MEERVLLSMFMVTNTGDNNGINPPPNAGTGTLRQAIVDVNADPDDNPGSPDQIDFAITGGGVQTISPNSELPAIDRPVIIDGYTQDAHRPIRAARARTTTRS